MRVAMGRVKTSVPLCDIQLQRGGDQCNELRIRRTTVEMPFIVVEDNEQQSKEELNDPEE